MNIKKYTTVSKMKWLTTTTCGLASASMIFGCEACQPPAPVQQDMTVTTLAAYDPVRPFSDLPAVTGSGREVTVDGLLFPVSSAAGNVGYMLLEALGNDNFRTICFVYVSNPQQLDKFAGKIVQAVGRSYRVEGWEMPVMRLETIAVNETETDMKVSAAVKTRAQLELGTRYYNRQDYAAAIPHYQKAASGSKRAQFYLAKCRFFGQGVTGNKAEALKEITVLAEKGHGESQFFLAACCYTGDGMEVNRPESWKWCRRAAENNVTGAVLKMVEYYDEVEPDKEQLAFWAGKAVEHADKGDATAQFQVGLWYSKGGVIQKEPDEAKCREYIRRAAEQQHPDAVKLMNAFEK